MSLIKCSDCGTRVSDQAASCPKCGAPASALQLAAKKKGGASIRVIASGLCVIALLVDVSVNANGGSKTTAQPSGVVASAPSEPQSVRELLAGIGDDVRSILGSFSVGIDSPHSPVNDPSALKDAAAHLDAATRKADQLMSELGAVQKNAGRGP
jgi:flagellin-like hook-associated protein FlgL